MTGWRQLVEACPTAYRPIGLPRQGPSIEEWLPFTSRHT